MQRRVLLVAAILYSICSNISTVESRPLPSSRASVEHRGSKERFTARDVYRHVRRQPMLVRHHGNHYRGNSKVFNRLHQTLAEAQRREINHQMAWIDQQFLRPSYFRTRAQLRQALSDPRFQDAMKRSPRPLLSGLGSIIGKAMPIIKGVLGGLGGGGGGQPPPPPPQPQIVHVPAPPQHPPPPQANPNAGMMNNMMQMMMMMNMM